MQGWRFGLGALATLAVVCGGVQIVGIGTSATNHTNAVAAETATFIDLTESADNGPTVVVPVGAIVTITLQSNPTTGYQWAIDEPLPTCLAIDAEPGMVPAQSSDNLVGATGQWRVTLKAERAEECTVLITYRRAWEKSTAAAKSFRVRVRVE